jgi:hypothetical protein
LVEQATGSYEPIREGGEYELPPGSVFVTYDDSMHARRISYKGSDGSLISTVVLDSAGATVAQDLKEGTNTVLDMKLECTYDDHGNWTFCRRWVTTDRNRKATGAWRRSIVYR